MQFQEIIIAGIIIIVAALVLSFVFSPTSEAHDTNIQILNKGDFGLNSTIYIKLTDNQKTSLSDQTVHVQLIDENGTVVYKDDVKTQATGVAMSKLSGVGAGNYTIKITYDGDSNYTASSLEKKVNVVGEEVEDIVDDMNLTVNTANQDSANSASSPTYSSSSSSYYSSSSSSSSSSEDVYYDENGNQMDNVYDEKGNQIDPTTVDDLL